MNYGYIRVSTSKQTLDNQRHEIRKFCQQEGIRIDGWIEETISGTQAYARQLGVLLDRARTARGVKLGRPVGAKNQKYRLDEKKYFIEEMLAEGASLQTMADALGVGENTAYKWLKRRKSVI